MINTEIKKLVIPEGWEIDRIEDNVIIFKESKKQLPKTWEECYAKLGKAELIGRDCKILSTIADAPADNTTRDILPAGLGKPMLTLMQLLVCREVYRQGWKPDWTDNDTKKYVIFNKKGDIKTTWYYYLSYILSFQSAEVRDEFLENFKDLIEEAKELI